MENDLFYFVQLVFPELSSSQSANSQAKNISFSPVIFIIFCATIWTRWIKQFIIYNNLINRRYVEPFTVTTFRVLTELRLVVYQLYRL